MHKAKVTKKRKVVARTDANQGIVEHNERVMKQAEWRRKKIEEKREELRKQVEAANAASAGGKMI